MATVTPEAAVRCTGMRHTSRRPTWPRPCGGTPETPAASVAGWSRGLKTLADLRHAGQAAGGAPPGADLAPSAGPVPGRCRALRTPARGPTAGRRGVSSRGRGLRTHVLESPDLRRVMRSPRGARELAPALGRALCLSAAWLFRWRTTIAGRATREAQRFT